HGGLGLCCDRPRPRARRAGDRGDQRADSAGGNRTNSNHGRLPAVLAARPGRHVRSGPRGRTRPGLLLEIALEAARAGADVLRRTGLGHGSAELKQLSGDYVTDADHASEGAIVEGLLQRAPGIPILAEEPGGPAARTPR